ncbi:MAG: hypothetical protein WCF90_10800 [Methanomicrobiales archaeon]
MVITGIAGRMADRIGQLVYLDVALPAPGQSLYDLLNPGGSATSGSKSIVRNRLCRTWKNWNLTHRPWKRS